MFLMRDGSTPQPLQEGEEAELLYDHDELDLIKCNTPVHRSNDNLSSPISN